VVLVSFVLVLAAAVTLVIGLLQTGLALIWLSIGCSVVAGLVLALAVVRGRPDGRPARVEPPRPVPEPAPSRAAPSYETASVGAPDWRQATEVEEAPAPWRQEADAEDEPAPAPAPRRRYGKPAATVDLTEEIPTVGKAALPIPEYDTLRATEIINRLDGLDATQLETLRAHEAAGKGRISVLARIDAQLESVQAPGWQVEEDDWDAAPEPEAEAEEELEEIEEPEEEPEPEEEMVEEELVEAVVVEEEPEEEPADADGFPIGEYDKLRVGQILPILRTLEPDELALVREREEQGQARSGVLDRIDALSGAPKAPKAAPAAKAAAPVKKAAPAKKAAAAAKKPAAATSKMTPMQAAIAAAKAKKGS
jgi:hypothetical protein